MKRVLKWVGIGLGVSIAGAITYEAVQGLRTRLRSTLNRADAIAEKTKDLVDESHSALHAAKQAL